jgi:hypothetical protein
MSFMIQAPGLLTNNMLGLKSLAVDKHLSSFWWFESFREKILANANSVFLTYKRTR